MTVRELMEQLSFLVQCGTLDFNSDVKVVVYENEDDQRDVYNAYALDMVFYIA